MSWLDKAKQLAAAKILVVEEGDQQTADMRWQICYPCEYRDQTENVCTLCGCPISAKIWSKISRSLARPFGEVTHCPMGKWNDKEITNYYRQVDGEPPLPE